MISMELQNNSLTTLIVQQCELSVKGKQTKNYTLCLNKYSCLIVSTKLVCLEICTLYVCSYMSKFRINTITTGAHALSKLLVWNCTLQVFDVSYNTIGDDGISEMVEQLQISTLTELNITQCGLSVKGT